VISSQIVMGNGGLIYSMIKSLGETDAHASADANNIPAQKVFALMVDHAAYDLVPAPQSSLVAAPVAANPPATSQNTIVPTAAPLPPVVGTTPQGGPVVAPNDTNALIQALIAQGQSQNQAILAAMQSLQTHGVDTSQPQVQQQLQSAASGGGMSSTTLLIIGAVAVGAIVLTQKH